MEFTVVMVVVGCLDTVQYGVLWALTLSFWFGYYYGVIEYARCRAPDFVRVGEHYRS